MRKSLKSLQKRMQEIGAEADSDEEIERRLESFDNLKRFDNTLERTNSYLGADRISVSVDLSDENLVIKAQFVN